MFTSTNLLVRAMRYKLPNTNKKPNTRIYLDGAVRKKNKRYYLTDMDYYWDVYLKSEHWKELRTRKLNANPTCECCGSHNYLDIHHINYKHLYNVELSDLKTLCRKCHTKEHNTPIIDNRKSCRRKERRHARRNNHFSKGQREAFDLRLPKKRKHKLWDKLREIRNHKEENIFNTYISIHY